MGPKSNDKCPYKRYTEDRQTDIQKREGGGRPREDRSSDWYYAATSQGVTKPPQAGRGKGRFFPRAFRGSVALQTS